MGAATACPNGVPQPLDGPTEGSNPRSVRRRLAGFLTVLIVAVGLVVLTGALDPRPRFALALPGGESFSPITVELRDATGLVKAMEPGAVRGFERVEVGGAVENPPGQARVLEVRWLGGACDDRTELLLAPVADGYTLSMNTIGRLVMGCNASGVVRIVNVILSRDVDASRVTIVRP